jgi:hypothetical protein
VNTKELTVLTACLVAIAACNEHPLKDSEMDHFGGIDLDDSEGGTGGEDEGETDEGETDDNDSDDSDSNGFPGTPDVPDGDMPDCGGDLIELSATPPNVMLVLDKSGSMTQHANDWDHDNDPNTPDVSRWTSLYDTVDSLLTRYDDTVNFGTVLFPSADAQTSGGAGLACLMEDEAEVPVAPNNRQAIVAAIPGRTAGTSGGTPARFGILNAVDHLTDITAEGSRAIVLVTDGEANCIPGEQDFSAEYDAELETAVESAYADNGIPTYVVGIDIDDDNLSGDDPRTLQEAMNDIAVVGGVPRDAAERFYNVTDHDALQAALDDIAARVSCTVTLDEIPNDPDNVELTIDGQAFDQVDTCTDGDGWRFTTDQAPYNTIELCGDACDAFVAAGALQTRYMCPPAG